MNYLHVFYITWHCTCMSVITTIGRTVIIIFCYVYMCTKHYYLTRMCKGKVTSLSICHSSVKITRSWHLGILVSVQCCKGVKSGERVTSLHFLLLNKDHGCYKSCFLISHVYRPHLVMPCAVSTRLRAVESWSDLQGLGLMSRWACSGVCALESSGFVWKEGWPKWPLTMAQCISHQKNH